MKKLLHVFTQVTDSSSSTTEPYIQVADRSKIILDTYADNCSSQYIKKIKQCLSSLIKIFCFFLQGISLNWHKIW
jgi:hypothetical protein